MIYTVTVYCGKVGLVVKKAPSLARNPEVQKLDGALAPETSRRLKVTQIGTEWVFFTLVTLALSGPEEALILVW